MKRRFLPAILLLLSLVLNVSFAEAKPFKRALVISGGGLSPGTGLGIIAGARAAGFNPDIIFVTCGASITASLYSGYGSLEAALNFARSSEHQRIIRDLLRIDTRYGPSILKKIKRETADKGKLPELFEDNVLRVPEALPEWLPHRNFRRAKNLPRFVVLAARAGFGPRDAGMDMTRQPLFKQVFFTDKDTAKYLRGRRSDIKRAFPASYVETGTEVVTGASLLQAYRASISDPYFINPARIGDAYYFTGAIDLFPIDTAKDLADEVMVTAPNTDYADHDVAAILNSFGFNQKQAAIRASKQKGVIFVGYGKARRFNPRLFGPFLRRALPGTASEFAAAVDQQFAAAYHEAYRAVKASRSK